MTVSALSPLSPDAPAGPIADAISLTFKVDPLPEISPKTESVPLFTVTPLVLINNSAVPHQLGEAYCLDLLGKFQYLYHY